MSPRKKSAPNRPGPLPLRKGPFEGPFFMLERAGAPPYSGVKKGLGGPPGGRGRYQGGCKLSPGGPGPRRGLRAHTDCLSLGELLPLLFTHSSDLITSPLSSLPGLVVKATLKRDEKEKGLISPKKFRRNFGNFLR